MRCATHPEVETNLTCGKCGKPICPRCMVHTPVGARCRDCAGLQHLPTYRVTLRHYLKAAGAGLGIAVACGIGWRVVSGLIPFFYLDLLVAAGVGYAIAEVVSLSVNRKRGRGLQALAGGAVVVSYLVSNVRLLPGALFLGLGFGLFDLLALALGILVAIGRLR